MITAHPLPPRRRTASRLVTAALTVVLASVLVVTTGGVLAVVLLVRDGTPAAPTPAAPAPGTVHAAVVPRPSGAPAQSPASAPVTPPAPVDAATVLAGVDAAAAAAGGTVDVVVLDAAGRPLVAGPSSGEVRYTASLVKLLVVGRLLALDATGALELGDRDLALMERAVVRSGDGAMSVLWDRFDGAALLTAAAADTGLTATAPPVVAGEWGEATTSAADVATFLAGLAAASGSAPAALLLGWMRATTATAADGFDQVFGLLQGAAGVAAKQGWMCCVDGRRQLHSAGVLPDGRVVVLLGDFPVATSWARARAALDAAAVAVLGALG
ncbi:Beta-lactamase enzyme family protein [Geodermatophilus amargosae]|uniref:Beta-lactamase enzyme family protein n=1 Tax=Geodermatophilus amargosae TaxID=1296565 RepID=A0A1I6Z2I8_9ACTN|nr:serine hydrolase [Geodermatophilus amargosae]SFT56892.1 Beta-lactamase enzyme family protein [Geodermatophilus amargosae]